MYYTDETIVYYNGRFMRAADAKGNLFDQTLHYGYGVFEGIRAYETAEGVKIFKAAEHFHRMEFSCEAVGIPYPFQNEELIDLSYELLRRNSFKNAYLRPLVTCPPNMSLTKASASQVFMAAWEWPAYLGDKLLRLQLSSFRRIHPDCFVVEAKVSGHYVNSIIATQRAKDAGFDEALLLDMNGFVAEAPGANLFMEKNGVLFTPEKGSILPGITRATVMEICRELNIAVVEKKITAEELKDADSVFLCGTAAEVIGVASIDDTVFPKAWNTSLGSVVQQAYKNLVLNQPYQSQLKIA